MLPSISPWLDQLVREREVRPLPAARQVDVAIVGGGIAGLSTAYWILHTTTRKVALLEAKQVAQGATGHNAGQITSYTERSFASIANEFGFVAAGKGQRAVEHAWQHVATMHRSIAKKVPYWSFFGYVGVTSVQQVQQFVIDNIARATAGLPTETIVLAIEKPWAKRLQKKHPKLIQLVPQAEILRLLETTNPSYVGAVGYRKGCMNSAAFTEALAEHLLRKYPKRFTIAEHTPVHTVALASDRAALQTRSGSIIARRVVLCTNGFETLRITNSSGPAIDAGYHHLVQGRVAYMAGYLAAGIATPTSISYLERPAGSSDGYYYLTRRPYDADRKNPLHLVCIGGPDVALEERSAYDRKADMPGSHLQSFSTFLQKTYAPAPTDTIVYKYFWHGLMGYTPNGLRCVGSEPKNTVLMYNLGCNGVGILPSIFGGWRIAQVMRGTRTKTVFDPRDYS